MNRDQLWQNLRYLLIAAGMYLAGRGKISADHVAPLADFILTAGGVLTTVGAWAWGVYVKFRTRSVPEKTAARMDVPTVSSATGAIER